MGNQQKQFVTGLLAYAAQRDLSAEKLCSLSDINLSEVMESEHYSFSAKQLNDLWMNACHLSNDPHFGLHLGESVQLAALGIVGEIVKSSTSVGQAITQAASLTGLITDMFRMDVEHGKNDFTIRLIPVEQKRKEAPVAFEQTLHFFMVFVIHELDGLILTKIQPKTVHFPSSAIDSKELERVLRCRPAKKGEEYAITFDNKYWDLPILTANYELQKSLLEKVATTIGSEAAGQSYQSKIYQHLLKNAYLGIVPLEEIAANFNVSTRSLQRKLKEENVTYQELADQVRKSLAIHYLDSGSYYVKEISYMLGYNELSAFSRAFKRWTGTTPVLYQKQA
jgi:AraC-like DNA-binding protein